MRQARTAFRANRGREPDAKELAALRQVWIDNEVLYREGLALQADRGDDMIRDRVIFKKLLMVDAAVQLPQMNDAQLRAWFEAHRDKYDEPMRYTFQEGVPAGDRSESGVRAFVTMLNKQSAAGDQGRPARVPRSPAFQSRRQLRPGFRARPWTRCRPAANGAPCRAAMAGMRSISMKSRHGSRRISTPCATPC